jgi:hypothetical protein
MTLEITKMLVISTGHLTEDTCNNWQSGTRFFDKGEWGFFANVGDEDEDLPSDLRSCMALARANECDWIMFDCDGPLLKELPYYEW